MTKKSREVYYKGPDCFHIYIPLSIQCVVRPKPEAALRTPQEALVYQYLNSLILRNKITI